MMVFIMSISIMALTEGLLLAIALSIDAFAASFAYGTGRIKIPLASAVIIAGICSGLLGISLVCGTFIGNFIPSSLTSILSFLILFILGIVKLSDSLLKEYIKKHQKIDKKIHFTFLHFQFILNVYADPQRADFDCSRKLSAQESISLALALSLDGLAAGFGAALESTNIFMILCFSLLVNLLAIRLGGWSGRKTAEKWSFSLSWLSGCILLLIALSKLI